MISFKQSPNKYSYSSGEENFDEDVDEENDINEVYSDNLRVGEKQPVGPPSLFKKIGNNISKTFRESEIGKTIQRRFTAREEGDHDSSDEEDKKTHWSDLILSIFRKKPKVTFYDAEEETEDTPIIEAYVSKESILDN